MEIKLAMKIFQVAVPIDEARQDGLTFDIDDLSASGDRDCAAPPDCLESPSLDNNDAIFDRRPAAAIDQSSTLNHERLVCHVLFFPPPNQLIAARRKFPAEAAGGSCLSFSSQPFQFLGMLSCRRR
jgi:hypothetical protein